MTHDRRELIRRLLQVSHRPRLVLRVAGGISAFLFACGVMDASGNAAVAHEEDTEITDPEEGAQFDLDEDVTVKIHGKPNTNYTITRFKVGSSGSSFNLTTNSEGNDSITFTDLMSEGDWIIQLREGHNNSSGPSLDTKGFTVVDDG